MGEDDLNIRDFRWNILRNDPNKGGIKEGQDVGSLMDRVGVLSKEVKDLKERATRDPHFPEYLNISGFNDVVVPEVDFALRNNFPLLLVYIDLDGMNSVNNKYGHKRGDEVIKNLGVSLRSKFRRKEDIIAIDHEIPATDTQEGTLGKWGGDEFIMAIPVEDIEKQTEIEEMLLDARRQFEETASEGLEGINPSFSFGISRLRETLAEEYNQDKIKGGNIEVKELNGGDWDPQEMLNKGLEVAEMRMYKDKNSRGKRRL